MNKKTHLIFITVSHFLKNIKKDTLYSINIFIQYYYSIKVDLTERLSSKQPSNCNSFEQLTAFDQISPPLIKSEQF